MDAMLKVLLSRFAFASRDVHLDVQPRPERALDKVKDLVLECNSVLFFRVITVSHSLFYNYTDTGSDFTILSTW